MTEKSQQFDFYEEYVAVKSGHLLSMMEHLIKKMQQEKCNVRHFRQWEAEMTAFKNEYHTYRKNILQRINDLQDESEQAALEKLVGPCCEEIEDRYEIMAQVFLEKRNEIKDKTTYFETQKNHPAHHFSLRALYDKVDIHILWVKMKRR